MRLSQLLIAFLPLLSVAPLRADTPAPPSLGARFDTRELLALGWRESRDPADFPLRSEGKSENLLLGLVPATGSARIFLLYSLPANPMLLDSIDTVPPSALLARLGVRRPEASGAVESNFLADPPLSAIHWTLTGPGDGTTFSAEAEPGELTYSLRTILSFVVQGRGEARRPLVVTAFLRCRPGSEAEQLKPKFFALLRTLAPGEKGVRLITPEAAISESTRQSLAQALAAATALLERQLPLLEAGKPLELTAEDRTALEAVLAVLPMDPVATYFLAAAPAEAGSAELDSTTKRAIDAYKAQARRTAQALEELQKLRQRYEAPSKPATPLGN